MVPYYLGAKQIAARLGYKSPRMVMKLMLRDGLPVYKRSKKHRTGACHVLAISESALVAWELSKGQQFVNQMRARQAERGRVYGYALAG